MCGTLATLFVFANLYAVRQSVVSLVLPRGIGNLDIGEEVPRRQLTWTAAALSLLIGIAFAWSQRDWSTFLAAGIGQPFGEYDPYFAADLAFFVYRLPLELSLFTWTMTVVLIVIGLVVLLYALTPSLRWEQGGLYISGYVRRHLAMLAGVLLLVLAWHYRLEMYTILGSGGSGDGAFSYVDHRVAIPASLLLALVTLGAGLTVLWAGWTGQMRLAFAAVTGVIVAALAARQLAPSVAASATEENGTPARLLRADVRPEMPPVLIVADSAARSMVVADSSGRIAGPSLEAPLARFAHALSMQDFRVWFGALPEPAPKLLARRTVRERVGALAPFFAQGSTIAPLWFADSLVWALELYSSSSSYPLSRRVLVAGADRAYFQHAATA